MRKRIAISTLIAMLVFAISGCNSDSARKMTDRTLRERQERRQLFLRI